MACCTSVASGSKCRCCHVPLDRCGNGKRRGNKTKGTLGKDALLFYRAKRRPQWALHSDRYGGHHLNPHIIGGML